MFISGFILLPFGGMIICVNGGPLGNIHHLSSDLFMSMFSVGRVTKVRIDIPEISLLLLDLLAIKDLLYGIFSLNLPKDFLTLSINKLRNFLLIIS